MRKMVTRLLASCNWRFFSAALALVVFMVFCGARNLLAVDMIGAQLRVEPAQPYVGQLFDLILEIKVTSGVELQDIQLVGLPETNLVSFAGFRALPRKTVNENGRNVDILTFKNTGRGLFAGAQNLQCKLGVTVVERRSTGFFSHWSSSPRSYNLEPVTLRFKELPRENIPENFNGAIGNFNLSGSIQPEVVQPGDIVTLNWEINGSGWLGGSSLHVEDPGGDFKLYELQETERSDDHLVVRQVAIPLNTNATIVGKARFAYFDPIAENYKVTQTGPYKLTFGNLEAVTAQETNSQQVVVIDTTQPLTRPVDGRTSSDVAVRMRNLRRSLPLAVALVLAVIIFNFMWRTRRWVAVLAALVILIWGLAEQRYLSKAQDEQIWQVVKNVSAKLCPSENALTIFDLSVGQSVTITETTAGWIRLNATGREGWVPRDCVIRP